MDVESIHVDGTRREKQMTLPNIERHPVTLKVNLPSTSMARVSQTLLDAPR
jgi:hypothetical protein